MFFFTLQVEGGVNQPTWDWLPWWKIWKPQVDYGSLQKEIENQLRIAKLQVQSADCHSCWGKYVFWVISRFGFHKISTRFKYIQIWDWKNNLNHIPTLSRADAKVFFSHGTLRYTGSMDSCVSTDIFYRGAHVLYDMWHVYNFVRVKST